MEHLQAADCTSAIWRWPCTSRTCIPVTAFTS